MIRLTTILLLFGLIQHFSFAQDKSLDPNSSTANEYMHQNAHEDLAKVFESSERDAWQKPGEVIDFLGEIENKTVVDVGSGSGYFSFRLLSAGAKVVAADVDQDFIDIIEQKKKEKNIDDSRLSTKLIDPKELNLEDNSIDIIFLVNVYHHVSDRVNYFSKANLTLNADGRMVIIDFYKKSLPVGPPKNHKISKDVVLEELKEAGYSNIEVNTDLLEYQYIITAYKY